jgi:hypothetical protein
MALLAVSLIAAPAAQAAVDVGMVRLPKDIKHAGRTIEKGRYMVSLGDSAEGPVIVLATKDGSRVADELAIVMESPKKIRRPRAYVHVNRKDEPLLRLTVRADQSRYLAFFELAE